MNKKISLICLLALISLTIASPARADTVALYLFDEGAPGAAASGAGTILESSGAPFPGTANLNPVYEASAPTGYQGTSLRFDQINDQRVEVPGTADDPFDISGDLTLEAWVRLDGSQGSQSIVAGKWGDTTYSTGSYLLYFNNGPWPAFAVSITGKDVYSVTGDTPLSQGVWYHLAGFHDPANDVIRLMVNGGTHTDKTAPFIGAIFDNDVNFHMGDYTEASIPRHPFNGAIDEVRLSNSVVPDAQLGYFASLADPVNANAHIAALSGCTGCDMGPGGCGNLPCWNVGSKIYRDVFHVTNDSAFSIPLPFRTVLTTLTGGVETNNSDPGRVQQDVPPDGYWGWDSINNDALSPSDGDNVLDPGETISVKWEFYDPSSVNFTFFVNAMTPELLPSSRTDAPGEEGADFSYRSAASTETRSEGRPAHDDGTAEIHVGANEGGLVIANRFESDHALSVTEIAFETSGVALGSPVEVVIYLDREGTGAHPGASMEVWRKEVLIAETGFQAVATGGVRLLPPEGGPFQWYVGIDDAGFGFLGLGIDLSSKPDGASYISEDGGASFMPLAVQPVVDGNAMIRATTEPVSGCSLIFSGENGPRALLALVLAGLLLFVANRMRQ